MDSSFMATIFPAPAPRASRGRRRTLTWSKIRKNLQKPQQWPGDCCTHEAEDRLAGWNLVTLRDNTRILSADLKEARHATESRVEGVYGLFLEYWDEPLVSADRLHRWWGEWAFAAYTTAWNDVTMAERPKGPRWRVLLPFDQVVNMDDARVAAAWARHPKRSCGLLHESTSDLSRVVALPAVAPAGYEQVWYDGPSLSVAQCQVDLDRWAAEERMADAEHALRATHMVDAVRLLARRYSHPEHRVLVPWPGARGSPAASDPPHPARPLEQLDRLAGSLWPGRMVVLASASGSGRTSLVLQLAESAALIGYPVLYAAPGLSPEELLARLLVKQAASRGPKLPASHIAVLEGAANPQQVHRACAAAMRDLSTLHIWTPTSAECTVEALEQRIVAVSEAHEGLPPLVVVDPIEDFDAHGGSSLHQLAAHLRDACKPSSFGSRWPGAAVVIIAGVPAHAASMFASTEALTAAMEPEHADHLAESMTSGNLAADSALLLGLALDLPDDEGYHDALVAVVKNRHGRTGVVPLRFYGPAGVFGGANLALEGAAAAIAYTQHQSSQALSTHERPIPSVETANNDRSIPAHDLLDNSEVDDTQQIIREAETILANAGQTSDKPAD
ncbi:MAG: hypothetical protein ACI9MC_000714 [Kiritimatiellia bacterium]|jgi:hypothetical protein